jgi:hypothetical protein
MVQRPSIINRDQVRFWTGFNIEIRDNIVVTQDTVAYLPTVNAPATELSTIHEVLNRTLQIMESLQLSNIVCVFDQALYAKALEIAWKHQEKFGCIIFRMGIFHTLCTLLANLGKRFGDAGLKDLCVESEIIADGSIGVLDGQKYNRAIRMHKIMNEALMRITWDGFLQWLGTRESDHLNEVLSLLKDLAGDVSESALQDVVQNFLRNHMWYRRFASFL